MLGLKIGTPLGMSSLNFKIGKYYEENSNVVQNGCHTQIKDLIHCWENKNECLMQYLFQSLETLDNGKPYTMAYAADLSLTAKVYR